MKRFHFTVLLLTISMMMTAQNKLTLDAQILVEQQQNEACNSRRAGADSGEQRVSLVVKVSDETALETYRAIRAEGGVIQGVLGQQAIVSLPLKRVVKVAELEGIERMDKQHSGRPLTDVTATATKVSDIVAKPAGDVTSLTGKGIMVCIIDGGIYYNHRAFQDANKKSRVKVVYLMNQSDAQKGRDAKKLTYVDPKAGEVAASGYYYDTAEGIESLANSDNEKESHGTNTAGIAAGTKSDKGFTGMAPEADIMFIPLNLDVISTRSEELPGSLEKALMFAVNYAKQHNLQMVVSMSIGSHEGPHDGTGTIPDLFQEAAKTVIPVMSSGNEGDKKLHISKTFTTTDGSVKVYMPMNKEEKDEDGLKVVEFTVASGVHVYSRQPAASGQSLKAQMRMYRNEQLKWQSEWVEVKYGDTEKKTWTRSGSSLKPYFQYDAELEKVAKSDIGIWGGIENGKFAIKLAANGYLEQEDDGGCESFTVVIEGSDGVEIDMWEDEQDFPEDDDDKTYITGDSNMSASDWVSSPYVISVGAYCANTISRQLVGENTTSSDYTLNDIAYFSSYGEFPNGVKAPTVCAPGVNVVSSTNPLTIADDKKAKQKEEMMWDGAPYDVMSGTSMSCPVVSGIIALWKQAKPTLTFEQVKKVLENACTTDAFTAKNTLRWGYGKIDAKKGLDYILTATGIEEVRCSSPHVQDAAVFDLQGRRVARPSRGLYIVNGKKMVLR